MCRCRQSQASYRPNRQTDGRTGFQLLDLPFGYTFTNALHVRIEENEFHINLMEGFMTDLMTFLSLANIKLVLG